MSREKIQLILEGGEGKLKFAETNKNMKLFQFTENVTCFNSLHSPFSVNFTHNRIILFSYKY
jgi:hypothetical protein